MAVVLAWPNSVIIEAIYTGTTNADLYDNEPIGWLVDPAGVTPPAPHPITLGSAIPDVGPPTAPILSPPWAQYLWGVMFVPDTMRGPPAAYFDLLAFNNGAKRTLRANFSYPPLRTAFMAWGAAHRGMAFTIFVPGDPAIPVLNQIWPDTLA